MGPGDTRCHRSKIRKIVRAVFQKFSICHHFWAILGLSRAFLTLIVRNLHANKLIVNLGSSAAVHRRCSSDINLSRPKAKKNFDQGFRHPYLHIPIFASNVIAAEARVVFVNKKDKR